MRDVASGCTELFCKMRFLFLIVLMFESHVWQLLVGMCVFLQMRTDAAGRPASPFFSEGFLRPDVPHRAAFLPRLVVLPAIGMQAVFPYAVGSKRQPVTFIGIINHYNNNMKKIKNLLLASLVSLSIPAMSQNYPFQQKNLPIQERLDDLVNRMTLEEKIDLLSGYRDFYLHPCDRLGIPAFKMADGPLGVASWGLWGKATAFPAALALSASWNRDLAHKVGDAFGQEWRSRGIHFLLAPGVNTYRASKSARNFEYMGEDPYLTSQMVVPFIKGVQDREVIATVKHYAANDQEFDRYTVSSEVGERALREIYLPPFEAAVKEAGVKAVMTGYNPVNGVYCTENKYLIDILKKEWGFKGMLMSDWACTHSDSAAINGLDLEMGSHSWLIREKLMPLIEKGGISEETINEKVRRIYGPCMEMGFFDRTQQDTSIPTYNPVANRIAYEAACEGMILLKNENILPLKPVKKIAVIGPNANYNLVTDRAHNVNNITYGGGGSSKVHPWYVTSVLQGVTAEFSGAEVAYCEGISNNYTRDVYRNSNFRTKDGKNGLQARYYKIEGDEGAALSEQLLKEQAKAAGRTEGSSAVAGKAADGADGYTMEQVDQHVDFSWWGSPNSKLGNEFGAEWTGYVEAEKTDSMTFFVDAQGAYRLYVGGKLLLDAWTSQSFDSRRATVAVTKGQKIDVRLEYKNQRNLPSEIRMGYDYRSNLDFSEPLRLARNADIVLFCAGLDGSLELEGRDRPYDLPYGQAELIRQLAAVNPNLVVSLHAGGGVEMSSWIDKAKAVVHLLYPGQEGGRAYAHLLSGKVVPSGKLPFSIERSWEESPACGVYDETRRDKKVHYNDGVFVGYRGYDQKGFEPLFPFGFGLSYTTFAYEDLIVKVTDKKKHVAELTFKVKNTGKVAGAEIVQVYVSDKKSKEPRPIKELKGFEKVSLQPGETREVRILLDENAFRYFNEKKDDWVVEKGEFDILVGASSKDIRLRNTIKL